MFQKYTILCSFLLIRANLVCQNVRWCVWEEGGWGGGGWVSDNWGELYKAWYLWFRFKNGTELRRSFPPNLPFPPPPRKFGVFFNCSCPKMTNFRVLDSKITKPNVLSPNMTTSSVSDPNITESQWYRPENDGIAGKFASHILKNGKNEYNIRNLMKQSVKSSCCCLILHFHSYIQTKIGCFS